MVDPILLVIGAIGALWLAVGVVCLIRLAGRR
jgi:hypothetical protein